MGGETISGTTTLEVVLGTYSVQNPVTVLASGFIGTGTLANDELAGIYGEASFFWTVDNFGHVEGSTVGIKLIDGGIVQNGASGSTSALIEGGSEGVLIEGTLGTVINYGMIDGVNSEGVVMSAGGSVGNRAGGLIEGENGLSLAGTAIVDNAGTITGTVGYGIDMTGGTVSNAASALIFGNETGLRFVNTGAGGLSENVVNLGTIEANDLYGVNLFSHYTVAPTLTNLGTIEMTGAKGRGVELYSRGYSNLLVNGTAGSTGALIQGGSIGVYFKPSVGGGTVVNYGTIEAASVGPGGEGVFLGNGGTVIDAGRIVGATAVYLGGGGSNLLILEHGYLLAGGVVGSGSAANTLELSGSLGAVSVSFNSLGLTHFGFVDFAAPSGGNNETLVISNTASLPGTIEGFTAFHDIIDLTNFTYHAGATVTEGVNDKLTIVSGSDTLSLQLAGSYAIEWHATTDGHGGTDVQPACFARGTLILTENGEVAVEELSIGHRVVTLAGAMRAIKWIGRRSYRGAFFARNSDLWPICVKAEALGPGMPRRDLYLSAHHALYFDGLLIPVECLVNGRSIVRCPCPDEIEYFHLELDSHDVILAEGAAAETFVDCDSRQIFQNASEFALLYPGEEPARWAFCAPRIEAGRELDAIRRRLLRRCAPFAGAAA
jgi:hypothetical protein